MCALSRVAPSERVWPLQALPVTKEQVGSRTVTMPEVVKRRARAPCTVESVVSRSPEAPLQGAMIGLLQASMMAEIHAIGRLLNKEIPQA
jgi:hypothetical protein